MRIFFEVNIGNDIVDIQFNRTHHPRFFSRVFSDREQSWLVAHGQRDVDVWTAWAGKEAAYKLMKQLQGDVSFELKKFEWDFDKTVVRFSGLEIKARVEVFAHERCVHVVCFDQVDATKVTMHARSFDGADESLAVRQLAQEIILKSDSFKVWLNTHGFASEEIKSYDIEFKKVRGKIPIAYFNDQEIPVAFSFSHDGEYVAVAMAWKDLES